MKAQNTARVGPVLGGNERVDQPTPEELVIVPEERHADGERLRRDSERGKSTLASDPITRRLICRDCWNGMHGSRKALGCKLRECHCLCRDALEEESRERSAHAAARRQREALMRQQLEDEANPLRSFNPSYREPWRTRATNHKKVSKRKNKSSRGPDFIV
jgi:hypothetical protein